MTISSEIKQMTGNIILSIFYVSIMMSDESLSCLYICRSDL